MTAADRSSPLPADSACCNLCAATVPPGQPAVWRKDGFDIVRCPGCGLLFRRHMPTAAEIREVYAPAYFHRPEGETDAQGYLDYVADEETHRLAARRRLDRLEAYTDGPGRLLDVGCASGFFLAEARAAGWDVSGIDVAPAMTAVARERFGLDVQTGEFADLDLTGPLDCVSMWDYLEHSVDPLGDVRRAAAMLREGGLLALSTGDAGSLSARLSGARWHLLTPRHHNYFFRREDLGRCVRAAGLELVEAAAWPRHASVRHLAFKLGAVAPRSRAVRALGRAIASRPAGRVVVPINLFDVVTVVARRPRGA